VTQTHEHRHDESAGVSPAEFWERRYAESGPVWSGRVNAALAEAVERLGLAAGRALDLGCGEGGDVLWLAERGWRATGIDLSRTAVERARAAAADRGLPDGRAVFISADLAEWVDRPAEVDGSLTPFDLVTASFLQSPVDLPRERVLRAAVARVVPGGHAIIVSHGSRPPWSDGDEHGAEFPSPEEELAMLALDESGWEVVEAEARPREVNAPNGEPAEMLDNIVIVRRRDEFGEG